MIRLIKVFIIFIVIFVSSNFAIKFLIDRRSDSKSSNNQYVDELFKFHGKPINPRIIEDLIGWVSDNGTQISSINLLDSQRSNRYFLSSDLLVDGTVVEYKPSSNDLDHSNIGYDYIGKTPSGVYVLHFWNNTEGSAQFNYVVLLTVTKDYGFNIDYTKVHIKQDLSLFKEIRVNINYIGRICLGDRWGGKLRLSGNKLIISDIKLEHLSDNNVTIDRSFAAPGEETTIVIDYPLD